MSPLDLLVDVLAVHRLTRLVTEDVITQGLRDAVIRNAYRRGAAEHRSTVVRALQDNLTWEQIVDDDPHPPKLAVLVTCRWCASIWIAGGVVAARLVSRRAASPLSLVLALSSAATLLASIED